MSEKYKEFIGYRIKIGCDNGVFVGEIVSVDTNTIVLTNASINKIITTTEFVGINQTLIHEMDIIKSPDPIIKNIDTHALDINRKLNVYTSYVQPPIIKRGGPSSAVHRNLMRINNTLEKNPKLKNGYFPDYNCQPRRRNSGSLSKEHYSNCLTNKDNHTSRNLSFNEANFRIRKTSTGSIVKEPPWMNYPFDDENIAFDFDSNLALFDKNAFYTQENARRNIFEGTNCSDTVGMSTPLNCRNERYMRRCNTISFETHAFPAHNDEHSKSFSDFKSQIAVTKESDTRNDVFTELTRMGIIPQPSVEELNCYQNMPSNKETKQLTDSFLKDHNFLQQPDIVQEVTKSQLCNSDFILSDQSTILSIVDPCREFERFSDFWKLDNDTKFPVFSTQQRDKLFQCAHEFGYNVRTIADQVGKTLSEFVVHQVGGVSRLNGSKNKQIPKIAVLLGRSQASVFVASMARYLTNNGCLVLAYFDEFDHKVNEDVDTEIELLKLAFYKCGKNDGFNYLTCEVKDLRNKTFDYIISGLDSASVRQAPDEDLITWCFGQTTPILSVNPPDLGHVPWKVAVFVGVPTSSYQNLVIRTGYECTNGYFKPRLDGVSGLEIEKMYRKPDGLILLCNVNLPTAVYNDLNLHYKSPFKSRNWIRLYRENDLLLVE